MVTPGSVQSCCSLGEFLRWEGLLRKLRLSLKIWLWKTLWVCMWDGVRGRPQLTKAMCPRGLAFLQAYLYVLVPGGCLTELHTLEQCEHVAARSVSVLSASMEDSLQSLGGDIYFLTSVNFQEPQETLSLLLFLGSPTSITPPSSLTLTLVPLIRPK